MTDISVKVSSLSDESKIMDVIGLSFIADPVLRWMYPDLQQFVVYLPQLTKAYGGRAIDHGSAYYVDGYWGAALWLPPDIHSDDEAFAVLLDRSIGDQKNDAVATFQQTADFHPRGPHWFLAVIGVDPIHQHKGIGSALIKCGLVPCDRDHLPAYLEATNPKNIPLYERHGFELLGTIQLSGCPPLFPMLRRPR
ncbi:GNAT family N-acetyltransferase [Hypericibacter sp.]|uniref:GNAT family N-acetyltransferase n=1 Tax=Hypericibacter sp. TaxID=2705401 RepID=UPI003D6D04EA